MSSLSAKSPFEQQIDLVLRVLEMRRGSIQHLETQIRPHLDQRHREAVSTLVASLQSNSLAPHVPEEIEAVIAATRQVIAEGVSEEKIAIPTKHLIGCTAAYDTRRVLSPKAESLQTALPFLEELSRSVKAALHFAEAVKVSRCLVVGHFEIRFL